MTSTPARRRRVAALTFAATLVVLLAGVALAEFLARRALGRDFVPGLPMGRTVQATAIHHPELGWANRPSLETRIIAPEFDCALSINSNGLRDREHSYEADDDVFRVVLLGDSIAWGWGVDDGLDFADQAEEALGDGVEILNLSCPGYSTDQQLLILEHEGWRYEPDLVLLCFVLNDTVGNASLRGQGMPFAKPRFVVGENDELVLENHPAPAPEERAGEDGDDGGAGLSLWLRENSALVQWAFPADSEEQLARSSAAAQGDTDGADPAPEKPDGRRRRENDRFKAQIERACEDLVRPDAITHRLLDRLARTCAERGVPLVGFSVSHHHDRYLYSADYEAPPEAKRSPSDYRSPLAKRLDEAGRALGFETFSVDAAMLAGVAEHGDLHVGDGHLNEIGNRIVAEQLVEELRPHVER